MPSGYFTDVITMPAWPTGANKPTFTYTSTDTTAATGTWSREASFEGEDTGFRAEVTGTGRQAQTTRSIDHTL